MPANIEAQTTEGSTTQGLKLGTHPVDALYPPLDQRGHNLIVDFRGRPSLITLPQRTIGGLLGPTHSEQRMVNMFEGQDLRKPNRAFQVAAGVAGALVAGVGLGALLPSGHTTSAQGIDYQPFESQPEGGFYAGGPGVDEVVDTPPVVEEPVITDQPATVEGTTNLIRPQDRPYETIKISDSVPRNIYPDLGDSLIRRSDPETRVGPITVSVPNEGLQQLVRDAYKLLEHYPSVAMITRIDYVDFNLSLLPPNKPGEQRATALLVISDIFGEGAATLNVYKFLSAEGLAACLINTSIIAREAQDNKIAARFEPISYQYGSADSIKQNMGEWEIRLKAAQETIDYMKTFGKNTSVQNAYRDVILSANVRLKDLRAQLQNQT